MPLDEIGLRREGFSEGAKVRLGDGQEWTFPKPYLSLAPRIDGDGKPVRMEGGYTFGRDYADRLDDLLEADDIEDRLSIQLELAAGLLLRNYALDNRALRRLLSMDLDGTETDEMWGEIKLILLGRWLPKPSAVGSEGPSGPTASTPT